MRLLLIEDDPSLSLILSRDLQEKGYHVDTSMNGEEGLYQAKNWPYDLVILDVMLPKMDGWTVLKNLRLTHQTPVLMLTAEDLVENRIKGLDLGADDYLTKPFHFDELQARILAIIRRTQGLNGAVIQVEDITINIDSQTVTKNNTAIELTSREYAILAILASRKDRMVSPADLCDYLAQASEDVAVGTVNVHIFNLRKKLGKSLIRTVRGLGYTIDS